MAVVIILFGMSNFYTEQDLPLVKIRTITHTRDLLITSPVLHEKFKMRASPLSVVTKLVLGELEKPRLIQRHTSQRIKDCQVKFEKERYV